jgi:NTE family protein
MARMHSSIHRSILSAAVLAVLTTSVYAGGETRERPRVGIAFSGGGAKGLAHIGVLKVLEEEGLQAEIITGTSMGSIIGGLYAAGYSPAFLERMALSVDWFDMFRETVDRRYLSIPQKMFRDRYLVALPVYGGRVQLPSGLIKGQKIHRLFYELTWPVIEIDDFSEFPRDFRCVATDIATGKPFVIDSGILADAMRASMAIPTAFAPVDMDGRLLVDGGLVRNLPSLDAEELGADIVICIDVSSDLVGVDSLRSLLEITDQTINILMRSTMDVQRSHCDLYIKPELGTTGTLDFGDIPYIIGQGEKAAREHIEQIRAIVEETGGFRDPPAQMEETPVTSIEITGIRLDGLSGMPSSLVSSLLGIKPPASVTAAGMDEALQRLYSTGDFSRISYRFEGEDGAKTLVLDIEEEMPDYIGIGVRYDTRLSFSALLGAHMRNLIGHGSILDFDMVVGSRVNLLGTYTIDAGLGRYLMPGVAGNYVDDYIETYVDGERISRLGVRAGRVALLVESGLGHLFQCALTGGGEWYSIRPDIAPAGIETEAGGLFFAGGDIWIDTLDRSWMPRRGIKLRASGQYFPDISVNEGSYGRAHAQLVAAVPVHSRVTVRGSFLCGITGGGTRLPHHRYCLGGIMSWFDYYGERDVSFFGYEPFEFTGADAYLAGADLQVEITGRWLVAGHFNAGAAVEERAGLFRKGNTLTGWAGTVAYDTPIGPAELTLSGSEERGISLWFGLGYRF